MLSSTHPLADVRMRKNTLEKQHGCVCIRFICEMLRIGRLTPKQRIQFHICVVYTHTKIRNCLHFRHISLNAQRMLLRTESAFVILVRTFVSFSFWLSFSNMAFTYPQYLLAERVQEIILNAVCNVCCMCRYNIVRIYDNQNNESNKADEYEQINAKNKTTTNVFLITIRQRKRD